MELEYKEGKLEVTGIPDAKKMVKLPRKFAKDIADLRLHHSDLVIALDSIEGINKAITAGVPELVEPLWRSGIVHLIKCFSGQRAREKLDPTVVYDGEPKEAMEAFLYFKALRNKHIAHDENAYLQALTGLALNEGNKDYKIERVLCLSFKSVTLEEGNYNNLLLLINKAKDYVDKKFYKSCAEICDDLEKFDYDDLLAFGELEFKSPGTSEILKTRSRD